MSNQTIKDFKYVVRLGRMSNSFYDADSKGCNLFRSNPYYAFNHEPTVAIINGVKGGRLIDVKGNIVEEKTVSVQDDAAINEMKKGYEAQIADMAKQLGEANAEILRLTEELEAAKAQAPAEGEEEGTDVKAKAKGKGKAKASDEE